MEDCEDTFYGHIITGPTAQTLTSFVSFNSSFTRCVRIHDPPASLPPLIPLTRFSDDADICTLSSSISSCTTSISLNFSAVSSTITIDNVLFHGCQATYYGGGFYCNKSSACTVNVTHSQFLLCSTLESATSDYYGGGGIFCQCYSSSYKTLLYVSSTNFSSCDSRDAGGAIYYQFTSNMNISLPQPLFQNLLFCDNSASYTAPDFFTHYSYVPSSVFSECYTYNAY